MAKNPNMKCKHCTALTPIGYKDLHMRIYQINGKYLTKYSFICDKCGTRNYVTEPVVDVLKHKYEAEQH